VLEHLGVNVRRLRRARDLTQSQLGRFADINQPRLSAIERGLRPSMAVVDRLAHALGVRPDELLRPVDRVGTSRPVVVENAETLAAPRG
jgi:transcriptional regulator with XRE-family HTH domain